MKDRDVVIFDSIVAECERLQKCNALQMNGESLARRLTEMVDAGLRRDSASVELLRTEPGTVVTVHAATKEHREEAKAIIQKCVPEGVLVLDFPTETTFAAYPLPPTGLVVFSGEVTQGDAELLRTRLFAYGKWLREQQLMATEIRPLFVALPPGKTLQVLTADELHALGLRRL